MQLYIKKFMSYDKLLKHYNLLGIKQKRVNENLK